MEIKFLKRNKKFKKGGLGVKPDLYWRYLLLLTFVLFLISLFLGWFLFRENSKEYVLPAVSISEADTIKKERINLILDYFKEREKKSKEILNSSSPIIDPSL